MGPGDITLGFLFFISIRYSTVSLRVTAEHVCVYVCVCSITQLYPTLCNPMDRLYPARLLYPWDFPGKNTEMGCHFLLQGIFLTQGSNPRLLHGQADSSPLRHQEKPLWHNKHPETLWLKTDHFFGSQFKSSIGLGSVECFWSGQGGLTCPQSCTYGQPLSKAGSHGFQKQ